MQLRLEIGYMKFFADTFNLVIHTRLVNYANIENKKTQTVKEHVLRFY